MTTDLGKASPDDRQAFQSEALLYTACLCKAPCARTQTQALKSILDNFNRAVITDKSQHNAYG